MVCLSSTSSFFHGRFKNHDLSPSPPPSSLPFARSVAVASSSPHALKTAQTEYLRCEQGSVGPSVSEESKYATSLDQGVDVPPPRKEERSISGIHVPRQKYISVSKVDLLDAILSMCRSEQEIEEFKRFAKCLDSILHAEHKSILEEMRAYYSATCTKEERPYGAFSVKVEEDIFSGDQVSVRYRDVNGCRNDDVDKWPSLSNGLDPRKLFGQPPLESAIDLRVDIANKFKRSFMKLLQNAQFEELSIEDLLLTDALNNDYLLRLPIYVDWKRTFESNAIIFRRGYATERQKGLLIVEKLDYLQSKLLQMIFSSLSKPMKQIGKWLNETLEGSHGAQDIKNWIEKVNAWLKEKYPPKKTFSSGEDTSKEQPEIDQIEDNDLPVWLAAQKAVSCYEELLSPVGPRGRLLRRLLAWIGIISSPPEASMDFENKVHPDAYLRSNFLPRITLSNIWEPATKESCGYNVWRMLKAAVYILFSQSILQEPSFQELVLLYTDKGSQNENEDRSETNPLQLKIYEKIPIPELPKLATKITCALFVVMLFFPTRSCLFVSLIRCAWMLQVYLDCWHTLLITNLRTLPLPRKSAVFLDVIAISALIIYVSRVALGYKQTWDRYQLLVNRTLYEKTLASGFGSVHFLIDASEQQQFKEAILVYAILLHHETYLVSCRKNIRDSCEEFIYKRFNEKIEMPIDKAVDTLKRLGLLSEILVKENFVLEVLPCSDAFERLKRRWADLLE